MFSPQHSVQTPAVGTDTQVHMLLHTHTQTHTISPRRPVRRCMPNTDLTVTYGGGSTSTKTDYLKKIRTNDRRGEEQGSRRTTMSWTIYCSLITSNLTHDGMVVFNCECVFISVSGRAAISCCTSALQYGHSGVSKYCVGRYTWRALTVWTVRFTVGIVVSQSIFWLLLSWAERG